MASKHLDATFIVWHKLDDQEIQDIAWAIEETLRSMGYDDPQVDISVTPNAD